MGKTQSPNSAPQSEKAASSIVLSPFPLRGNRMSTKGGGKGKKKKKKKRKKRLVGRTFYLPPKKKDLNFSTRKQAPERRGKGEGDLS